MVSAGVFNPIRVWLERQEHLTTRNTKVRHKGKNILFGISVNIYLYPLWLSFLSLE